MKSQQLFFVFLFSIITFLSVKSQTKNTEGWQKLNIDQYEIKLPNDWDVDTSGQAGTSFILLSPVQDKNDQFRENVNLLIQDLAGHNITLNQYVDLTENQVETLIQNGQLILSERITTNTKNEYHKMIYTGKQGIYNLKFQQYFWIVDHKAIILTLTCEVDQFDKYLPTGEMILDSFTGL